MLPGPSRAHARGERRRGSSDRYGALGPTPSVVDPERECFRLGRDARCADGAMPHRDRAGRHECASRRRRRDVTLSVCTGISAARMAGPFGHCRLDAVVLPRSGRGCRHRRLRRPTTPTPSGDTVPTAPLLAPAFGADTWLCCNRGGRSRGRAPRFATAFTRCPGDSRRARCRSERSRRRAASGARRAGGTRGALRTSWTSRPASLPGLPVRTSTPHGPRVARARLPRSRWRGDRSVRRGTVVGEGGAGSFRSGLMLPVSGRGQCTNDTGRVD